MYLKSLSPFFLTPFLGIALFFLSSMFPPALFAQETTEEEDAFTPLAPAPAGTVSCFDYYHFGSVQAKLTPSIASTVSGAVITFSGTLENANPYPIVDGALYVKIFKNRGLTNDGNGPDVVDQFFVKEDIVIPGGGSVPVSFQWRVPSYAQSGNYQLATFFTTSHKFNLLGLSFTDDVVGNTVPFKVAGEQEVSVSFDKTSAVVNGTPYYFAAFPPRVSAGEPVTVGADIANTGLTNERANITWKVYQWDTQREENLVEQKTTSVTVSPRGTAPVSITITDTKYPVYLVVGEMRWKDMKSVIGIRFVREGVDRTRLNFPGIMSFPLKAGEENTLFSCLHNSAEADVPNGRLELTLTDRRGRTIAEHAYDGTVTSAMMGVVSTFAPSRDYDYAVLDARLYSDNTLTDEARVVYDCEAINPSMCTSPTFWSQLQNLGFTAIFIIGGIVLLLVLILLLAWMRRVRPQPPSQITNQP